MRLEPFAEGIAAGHVHGPFEIVPGAAVFPVDDRGPAEVVVAPADPVGEAETLEPGERGLEDGARVGTLPRLVFDELAGNLEPLRLGEADASRCASMPSLELPAETCSPGCTPPVTCRSC